MGKWKKSLISKPRATSQPTKMLEAHLEEGALCSLDGPGKAPCRCFTAQRTSWPTSFSPCSFPCDCSRKKAARACGQCGSVCVQSLHYSSHLLTGCSTEAIIFSFVLIDAAAECAASRAPEREAQMRRHGRQVQGTTHSLLSFVYNSFGTKQAAW